jgi:hypothetical protein
MIKKKEMKINTDVSFLAEAVHHIGKLSSETRMERRSYLRGVHSTIIAIHLMKLKPS